MPKEEEEDCIWAVNAFNECVIHSDLLDRDEEGNIITDCDEDEEGLSLCPPPKVILTDQEKAFKKALAVVYPLPFIKQLLCVWHVNKNVLGKAQRTWKDDIRDSDKVAAKKDKLRKQFIARWRALC